MSPDSQDVSKMAAQHSLDRRAFLFDAGARALDAFAGAVESLTPEEDSREEQQPTRIPSRPGHDPCLEPAPSEDP